MSAPSPGAVTARTDRMSIVLPGTWAGIPLDDEKSSDAAISTLIRQRVGRDDRLVTVRRDARDRLREVAREAREAGVAQLALSLEILPGVPFPASFVTEYRAWPRAEDATDVGARLRALLPEGELMELESGLAVRTWAATTIRPGTQDIPDVKLEYFVVVPRGDELLHLVADVPVDCDAELVATLFDAIVDSIRWYPEVPAPAAEPDGAPRAEPGVLARGGAEPGAAAEADVTERDGQ